VAVGAMNAAVELGVKVPEDVAIIGFDDLPMASWPVFSLTTVRVAFAEMSSAVVELLVGQLNGDSAPSVPHVFPTVLVLRRTHGAS
jgi:LacI family transcriptional regulator